MNKVKFFLASRTVGIIGRINRTYEKINLYKLKGEFGRIGSNPLIELPVSVMNPEKISIGNNFTARAGLKLRAYTDFLDIAYRPEIRIGNNVHLAADCTINCLEQIVIGDNCALGAGSKLMDHMHGYPGYEDLHLPVMKRVLTSRGGIRLGDNVYVGAGVVILAGVEIGDNCIIGSNAVVTKSIPPNSIAAGIPARVIRTVPMASNGK